MIKNKQKIIFYCKECGYESLKWIGRCPSCARWNTFVEYGEEDIDIDQIGQVNEPVSLESIDATHQVKRLSTDIEEFDRVLGGGCMPGSLVLIGGEPGIGKSTLVLQVGYNLSKKFGKILYVSAEESIGQIKLRADRVLSKDGKNKNNMKNLYLLAECNIDKILNVIEKLKPIAVIIDSIQTVYREKEGIDNLPGSIVQIKDSCMKLMHCAKSNNLPIFIVGHVTKEGTIAGPKILEHMVDTVLYFEGEKFLIYRILRAVKNRYGSTNEVGVFEMKKDGLEEVRNPSLSFLQERQVDTPGSCVIPTFEGTRPILIELQALVTSSNYNYPRREAIGINYNRCLLIIGIVEKYCKFALNRCDIFINVVGGLRVEEPAADIGIVVAIASSYTNKPVDKETVVVGEVGLAGELRSVAYIEKRIEEAKRIGFKRCILPIFNKKEISADIELIGAKNIIETLKIMNIF